LLTLRVGHQPLLPLRVEHQPVSRRASRSLTLWRVILTQRRGGPSRSCSFRRRAESAARVPRASRSSTLHGMSSRFGTGRPLACQVRRRQFSSRVLPPRDLARYHGPPAVWFVVASAHVVLARYHGKRSPSAMGPQRPPIASGGSSGASPLADSHPLPARGAGPSGPPGRDLRPLKIPGEAPRIAPIWPVLVGSLPPQARISGRFWGPPGAVYRRKSAIFPEIRPLFPGFSTVRRGPKKGEKTPFLTPPGAESRGSGGAPPTHLILLRNQRAPPAPGRPAVWCRSA